MSTQAIQVENGGGEKKVPVVIDTHEHPASTYASPGGPASPHASQGGPASHAPVAKQHVLHRLKTLREKRKEKKLHKQHLTMPHNIDAAPPSISEIWGETLTWGMAALALFSVIMLASVFFAAMQFFSAGNSQDILREAQERLEEAP